MIKKGESNHSDLDSPFIFGITTCYELYIFYLSISVGDFKSPISQ